MSGVDWEWDEWMSEGGRKQERKEETRDKILNAHLISSVWTLFEIKLKSVGVFFFCGFLLKRLFEREKQLKHGASFASIKECGSVWSPKVNTKLEVKPWCSNQSVRTCFRSISDQSLVSFFKLQRMSVWSWEWIKYDGEKDPTACHGDSRLCLSLNRRFLQLIGWTVMSNET